MMARGKHAVLAANRRETAARELVDRMAKELVEARWRARTAEARALQADRLEALLKERNNDELLAETMQKLKQWKKWYEADRLRRKAAIREFRTVVQDLNMPTLQTELDIIEFMRARYPKLTSLVTLGGSDEWPKHLMLKEASGTSARRFDEEKLFRFQQLIGARTTIGWDDKRDAATVAIDMLEATAVAFTPEEAAEYVGLP